MEKELFTFKAIHKALGAIETTVTVYDNKISMMRRLTGVLAMNVKLPSETTVYYRDLSGINFNKPTLINSVGWIELSGVSGNTTTMKTVDVNGKMFSNVDTVSALGNPYCIVFSKQKGDMEESYLKVKKVFDEYKANESGAGIVNNIVQEESSLDKIKKLKELFDMGAISLDEYEEKKKVILSSI